jgi:hypothetical protein
MRKQLVFNFLLLMLALTPAALFAKGKTVKIVLESADLAAPIEMTEPGLEVFGVWEGPGVHADGVAQKDGFIIDWRSGAVYEHPAGLAQYKVSFYADFGSEVRLVYQVFYEHDFSTQEGYVYLAPIELNVRSIYRGLEGNWFRATADWEQAVREAYTKAGPGRPGA